MTVEQMDVIDFAAIDRDAGEVLFVISDHLPWYRDEGRHLELLRTKVYRRLDEIEAD